MATSESTNIFHLNLWASGDQVLMEDFNRDNRLTEQALVLLQGNPNVGSFLGDGGSSREFVLNRKPKFMVIQFKRNSTTNVIAFVFRGGSTVLTSSGMEEWGSSKVIFTDTGFRISSAQYGNVLNETTNYALFY